MATTGTPKVNKPTNLKEKEADVNRKLQLYGIINAFQNGKVPSVCAIEHQGISMNYISRH